MSTSYFHGASSGEICCLECAGYALTESIKNSRKNQKTFKGAQDLYVLMKREEIVYLRDVLDTDKICHC